MTAFTPDSQSLNYTHMYEFEDLRPHINQYCLMNKSITNHLSSNPEFSRFLSIVYRARLYEQLDEISANFTLFAPTNNYLKHIPETFFTRMDIGLARDIVNASLVNRKIDKTLITSSPVAYYFTMNPQMRMYVTNVCHGQKTSPCTKTRINNCVDIVQFDINLQNGLIHVINGLIMPTLDTFLN
jgi:uncharacterized surface protein with fasciclin (FAS1) repeats